MRIKEILSEGPTVADVIRSASQAPKTTTNLTTPPGTVAPTGSAPPGAISKIGSTIDKTVDKVTDLKKDAQGNKFTWGSAVAQAGNYNFDGSKKEPTDSGSTTTSAPQPNMIQKNLKPGQTVDLGNLGKVKVVQVTPTGVDFDGVGTPIGSKFTVPFKNLNQL